MQEKRLSEITAKAIEVGGCVRDVEINRHHPHYRFVPNDFDYLVLGETIESMLYAGFNMVGKDFPVFHHPVTKDEYALPRKEVKTGKGYGGFSWELVYSFKEDSARRDLTINSMGKTPSGELLDPFNGLQDIQDKVLRHTTKAFAEDPLRVLRLARFYARLSDFSIADETIELAKTLKEELGYISKERVFKELEKVLTETKPSRYFRALLEMDALDVVHPEIFAMVGVEQRTDYHSEGDVFEHTMRVLDSVCLLSDDVAVRYAAIYHDIGKPATADGSGSFHGHEDEDLVKDLFFNMEKTHPHSKKMNKLARKVAINHTYMHKFDEVSIKKIVKRINSKHFPKTEYELEGLLTVVMADNLGRISGNRKLSFDEVEHMYSGGEIEGFSLGKKAENFDKIRAAFYAATEKVVKPAEIIEKGYENILQYEHKTRISRVSKAFKELEE